MQSSNKFQSPEAEKAVLGTIISDESFSSFIPQLLEDDFSNPDSQSIFRAMRNLYLEKRPIDLVTINEVLSKMFADDSIRLTTVAMDYAGAIYAEKYHIKEYISILKECSMRRKMLSIIEDTKKRLIELEDDTSAILEKTRQDLRDIVVTRHSWKNMADVMTTTFDAIERKVRGEEGSMPSGIGTLDIRTAGFHKGELTIIGARPAVGKSAMGANIAMAAAEQGFKVGVCSREMTDIQYGLRLLSRESGIKNDKLRNGDLEQEDWVTLSEALGILSVIPMSFVFTARFIEDLRMEVQKKVDSGDLDMLMVDYTQLMQSRQKFDGDWLRIGYVSKMLKDMSTDFNIAVIALAQVGRSVENSMPSLADLRGSGDLEQDADNVIFMHRPRDITDRYIHPEDKELFSSLAEKGLQYIVLNIAKQRQGEIGTTAVIFDPSRMRYMPIERRD